MAEEKKLQVQTFTGGLDSDTADELIKSDCYRYGQNIRIFSSNGSTRGIVTNIKGSVEIPFEKPEGLNFTIGAKSNPEKNKLIFFNWNENGYHVIYIYDILLNIVYPVIRNLTDTNGVDILKFKRRSLILMIDWIGDLVYWVDGQVKQKKFNILKALDKTSTGYGTIIEADFINAYKKAPIFPPKITYFTDTSRLTNYLYGHLYKSSYRFIYDDGEKSVWSEFSQVPLPLNESFIGNASVSNVNNCLKIAVETGSRIVSQIEIAIKSGSKDFDSIITLDKRKRNIGNNTLYVYSFYNDNTSYSGLVKTDVDKAYSFSPDIPKVQAFVDRAIVYGVGSEGFETVDIDLSVEAVYTPLFLPNTTPNELNEPIFTATTIDTDFTREGHGRRTNSLIEIKIGHDVKLGNKFELFGRNGHSDNTYSYYTAKQTDDMISVANAFRQELIATGRVLATSPELPATDIWANTIDGSGDLTFRFIFRGVHAENATEFEGRVNPVSFQGLKDSGQSVGNHKSGGSVKYGLLYWNEDTKRSETYTEDDAFIRTDFVTESGGFKRVEHKLSIKHPPPSWAQYYEVTRTLDLTYGNGEWIQILIQRAIESQSTTNTEYVDLVVGSLFTYQKMYPNTIVNFNFEKNDRVRFIKKENSDTLYSFLETVVLDYSDNIVEDKNEDITTNNTNTVTIGGATFSDNIGRTIEIDGIERIIVAAPSGTTYTLDRTFGTNQKYSSYKIIDRRGVLRVRKPVGVTIEDNSLIEVYKPTQNIESVRKIFYLFGHKYAIKDWGTASRCHTGNVQNQNPADPSGTPAIVSISKGMSYVRQRQLPTNNIIPGTQAINDLIEDKSYSDNYESDLNDNGKLSSEDEGYGVRIFPERLRFSRNKIEDTRINGLNDFDNTDRVDYNDPYGAFMLLVYREGIMYAYKYLKTGYIPILSTILQGDDGVAIGLSSAKTLLNKLQYFAHEGGIGKNPESHASHDTWQWFASANSGTLCRTGGDGILPISEQFNFDSQTKIYLKRADKYNSFIFGGFDPINNEYVPSFEKPKEYLSNGEFSEAEWETLSADLPEGTLFEVTTDAAHGSVLVDADGNFLWTPDTDYIGADTFFFRYKVPGGEWTTPMKRCLLVNEQVIPDSPSIYYNNELIVPFVRNNCNPGYHGSSVDYKVEQYTYNSPYNQGNADQQAQDDADANGQSFANDPANGGTCALNAPAAFDFVDQTGLEPNAETISAPAIIPSTYPTYVATVANGTVSINGGEFTASPGTVNAGDSVRLKRNTSSSFSTSVTASLTVGGLPADVSFTTRAANNVEVNWSVVYGIDPTTTNGIIFHKNGVEVYRFNAGSGTLPAGTYKEGDTIQVYQFAYAVFRWAPDSSAELTVERYTGATMTPIFNGTVTDQTPVALQDSGAYVIAALVDTIDVFSVGASTAVGYVTETLQSNNYLAQDELVITLTDNSEAGLGLDELKPANGTTYYAFNVLGTSGTLTGKIDNPKATPIDYSIIGEGGYNKVGTIAGLGTVTHADIPKGGVVVEATDNNGAIACDIPINYSGGATYPTVRTINLGSGTGTVHMPFDANNIPDKFILEYEGAEVINTGYRGDTSYQAALDAALAAIGAPTETITAPGNGSASFVKSTATTTATLYIYGPLGGTAWDVTVQCPV